MLSLKNGTSNPNNISNCGNVAWATSWVIVTHMSIIWAVEKKVLLVSDTLYSALIFDCSQADTFCTQPMTATSEPVESPTAAQALNRGEMHTCSCEALYAT